MRKKDYKSLTEEELDTLIDQRVFGRERTRRRYATDPTAFDALNAKMQERVPSTLLADLAKEEIGAGPCAGRAYCIAALKALDVWERPWPGK